MAIILNIDTSGDFLYLSVAENGKALFTHLDSTSRNHANALHVSVENILAQAKMKFSDLQAIALLNGPGSYTGLRIGLSAAKGYAFALDIPLVTINNLDFLAEHYLDDEANNFENNTWISAIFSMKDEIIYAVYQGKNKIDTNQVSSIIDLHKQLTLNTLVCFSTNLSEENLLQNVDIRQLKPNMEILNKLSFKAFKENQFASIQTVEPDYIKKTYIIKKKKL